MATKYTHTRAVYIPLATTAPRPTVASPPALPSPPSDAAAKQLAAVAKALGVQFDPSDPGAVKDAFDALYSQFAGDVAALRMLTASERDAVRFARCSPVAYLQTARTRKGVKR